jgi:hypothetical protein
LSGLKNAQTGLGAFKGETVNDRLNGNIGLETPIEADDPRVLAKAKSLRRWITLDAAIDILAMYMVAFEEGEKYQRQLVEVARVLGDKAQNQIKETGKVSAIALDMVQIARRSAEQVVQSRDKASKRGKNAAEVRHNKPGSTRDKQNAIRSAWASGKYSSRDLCAEQECAALNMAVGTARRALRNTPEPLRRCSA